MTASNLKIDGGRITMVGSYPVLDYEPPAIGRNADIAQLHANLLKLQEHYQHNPVVHVVHGQPVCMLAALAHILPSRQHQPHQSVVLLSNGQLYSSMTSYTRTDMWWDALPNTSFRGYAVLGHWAFVSEPDTTSEDVSRSVLSLFQCTEAELQSIGEVAWATVLHQLDHHSSVMPFLRTLPRESSVSLSKQLVDALNEAISTVYTGYTMRRLVNQLIAGDAFGETRVCDMLTFPTQTEYRAAQHADATLVAKYLIAYLQVHGLHTINWGDPALAVPFVEALQEGHSYSAM